MKLQEIARTDSKDKLMKVKASLLALIAHPTTEPALRDNAVRKLKLIQQQITDSTLAARHNDDDLYDRRPDTNSQSPWEPEMTSTSRSGYVAPFSVDNSNLVFVERDGILVRYSQIIRSLKPYRPEAIAFGPADPSSRTNISFDARHRPSFTLSYDNVDRPPHPDLICDALRQYTNCPWDLCVKGKKFVVTYEPQADYEGPRRTV